MATDVPGLISIESSTYNSILGGGGVVVVEA
jgi:hypothetical protein